MPTDHAEQDPVGVVADAIARHWADQPAVARRDELHRTAELRPMLSAPLGPVVLHALLERHHQLTDALAGIRYDADQAERQLANNQLRRQQTEDELAAARGRLEHADRRIDELERPTRRLLARNRQDAASWRNTAAAARSAVNHYAEDLDRLDAERPQVADAVIDTHEKLRDEGAAIDAVRDNIAKRLNDDLRARAANLAHDPPDWLTHHVGTRPPGIADAFEWTQAAALIDQHRAAWGVIDTASVLGPQPRWEDRAHRASYEAASAAAAQSLHLDLAPEPRGMSLSR